MRERGGSLLETVAAIAVGATFAAAAATHTRVAMRVLAEVRTGDRALTAARNTLEHAIGAPCDRTRPPSPHWLGCPASFVCELEESVAAATPARGLLVRTTVRVLSRTNREQPLATLATVIRRPPGCS